MSGSLPVIARHAYAVIGAGVFGASFAYGLARRGHDVVLLDEGDIAYRAARGNFGLLWVQGKNPGNRAYTLWTRQSSDLWPDLAEELHGETGVDLEYQRRGGFTPCLDEANLNRLAENSHRIAQENDPRYSYEILDPDSLRDLIPSIGPRVVGALFCPHDGHVNPLALLRALQAAFLAKGGKLTNYSPVSEIEAVPDGYALTTPRGTVAAERVVIAAGLGSRELARQVGIDLPVAPNRGQVLVTERMAPVIPLPNPIARQMGNGTIQIGFSEEDVGFDRRTTLPVLAEIAKKAQTMFPALGTTRVARAWGCLRTLTPDRCPVYEQAPDMPGVFAAVAHSGVTLAAVHVYRMAGDLAEGRLPEEVRPLSGARFHV